MEKPTGTSPSSLMRKKIRTITIEEAYASPSFMNGPRRALKEQAAGLGYSKIIDQLCEIGKEGSPTWTPPASMCRCCR